MKPVTTQLSEHAVTLVHGTSDAPVMEMTYWLHGRDRTIERNPDEAPDAFWVRVLGVIQNERNALRLSKSLLNPNANVTVYAGKIDGIDLLRRQFMREHLIESLHREAGAPNSTGATGSSRSKALGWLAQIHGVVAPRKTKARATKENSAKP